METEEKVQVGKLMLPKGFWEALKSAMDIPGKVALQKAIEGDSDTAAVISQSVFVGVCWGYITGSNKGYKTPDELMDKFAKDNNVTLDAITGIIVHELVLQNTKDILEEFKEYKDELKKN